MKAGLPWLLVLIVTAGLGWQLTVTTRQQAELAAAHAGGSESPSMKAALDSAKQQQAKSDAELERLRNDNKELLRLRSEVAQLRQEKQQLTKQVQTAQAQAQSAQEQAQNFRQQADNLRNTAATTPQPGAQPPAGLAEALAKRYGLSGVSDPQAATCLNNQRMLDGAKQQWALENNQPSGAAISVADLLKYIPSRQLPTCPAGGGYNLGVVGSPVSCTVPGHAPK